MARIADLLAAGRTYSFEFSPPGTEAGWLTLGRTIAELDPLNPSFVSVTYGAGGGTASRTHEARRVDPQGDSGDPDGAPHVRRPHPRPHHRDPRRVRRRRRREHPRPRRRSAVGSGHGRTERVRVRDRPRRARAGIGRFSVGVAAHPEVHPRSADRETDRDHLAAKLRAADFAITQFFFEVEPLPSPGRRPRRARVDKPVIPGHHADHEHRVGSPHGPDVGRRRSRPGWPSELEAVADDPDAGPSGRRRHRHRAVPANCSTAARPACTSTRSTGRPRPARSTPTSVWLPERCPA